ALPIYDLLCILAEVGNGSKACRRGETVRHQCRFEACHGAPSGCLAPIGSHIMSQCCAEGKEQTLVHIRRDPCLSSGASTSRCVSTASLHRSVTRRCTRSCPEGECGRGGRTCGRERVCS